MIGRYYRIGEVFVNFSFVHSRRWTKKGIAITMRDGSEVKVTLTPAEKKRVERVFMNRVPRV